EVIVGRRTKEARLSTIGADSNSRHPTVVLFALRVDAEFTRTVEESRIAKSRAATAMPSAPAPIKAPRHPHWLCIMSALAGATAEPSIPAKVCTEKACPMRSDGTCCDSSE